MLSFNHLWHYDCTKACCGNATTYISSTQTRLAPERLISGGNKTLKTAHSDATRADCSVEENFQKLWREWVIVSTFLVSKSFNSFNVTEATHSVQVHKNGISLSTNLREMFVMAIMSRESAFIW